MVTIHDITYIIPAGDPSDDNNMPHAAISRASQWLSATACKHHCIAQGRKEGRNGWLNQITPVVNFLAGWKEGELSLGLGGSGQVCGHTHELARSMGCVG